jgi:multidrug resistance efflux pump
MAKHRLALYGLFLCARQACSKKQEVVYPQHKSITQSVYASGIVKSRGQYQVFSKVAGVIDNMLVTEGDSIKKGQLLATITNSSASLAKDISQLTANYNAVENNQARLQQLQYDIQVAKQKSDNDSSLYARQLNLWQQGIGTKNELDQRALTAKNSATAYKNNMLQYDELQRQIDFQAEQSKLNAQISSRQAGDLQVISDVNGKVFSVLKKQGEMVTAQTPIAIVGESGSYYMELQVDEYDIAQVKTGQQVLFTMDSYRGQVFEGVVTKIYPMMNDRFKTFTLEALFTRLPPALYPNLTAEANIVITGKQNALLIPRSYLIDDDYVLLKTGEKRKVQTGLKDYQQVEIINGITDKDALVKPTE